MADNDKRDAGPGPVLVACIIGAITVTAIVNMGQSTRINALEARVLALETLLTPPTDTVYPLEAP